MKLGWEDYLHWQQNDKKMLKRINLLIKDSLRDPFDGIGKPEPLKANFTGWWSRRVGGRDVLQVNIVWSTNLRITGLLS